MEDFAGRDGVHDLAACAEGGERESAADGFRKADHVGLDVEVFASAATAELCAGFHFVKDEQRAMLSAKRAQTFKEASLRHANADVHRHRFEDQRGDLPFVLFESAFDAREIVKGGDQRVLPAHDSCAGGNLIRFARASPLFRLGLHADHGSIVHAVVAAFEFDDLVASGETARQADGVHGGFGAAVAEADILHRVALDDLFGELTLHLVRHAIHGAALELLLYRLHYGGM